MRLWPWLFGALALSTIPATAADLLSFVPTDKANRELPRWLN